MAGSVAPPATSSAADPLLAAALKSCRADTRALRVDFLLRYLLLLLILPFLIFPPDGVQQLPFHLDEELRRGRGFPFDLVPCADPWPQLGPSSPASSPVQTGLHGELPSLATIHDVQHELDQVLFAESVAFCFKRRNLLLYSLITINHPPGSSLLGSLLVVVSLSLSFLLGLSGPLLLPPEFCGFFFLAFFLLLDLFLLRPALERPALSF